MAHFLLILILTVVIVAVSFSGLAIKAILKKKGNLTFCSNNDKAGNCGCTPTERCD